MENVVDDAGSERRREAGEVGEGVLLRRRAAAAATATAAAAAGEDVGYPPVIVGVDGGPDGQLNRRFGVERGSAAETREEVEGNPRRCGGGGGGHVGTN